MLGGETMRVAKVFGSCVVFVCMAFFCVPCFAQSESQKATADALFDAARRLMEEKKFAEACQKFKDSHAMDPAVGTLLNLALCYKAGGKTASAWSTYREAAAYAKEQGSAERERLAREEADKLEGELSRLVIDVSGEAAGVGELAILRDGQAQPRGVWGVPLPVDPGNVVLEWSAPGYEGGRKEVTIQGEGKTVPVTIPALRPLAPEDTISDGRKEEADGGAPREKSSKSAGPLVLFGIGVAAGAVGGTFAVLTLLSNKSAKKICADQDGTGTATSACTDTDILNHARYVDRAHTYRTVAYVGVGVGGAALIGAGIWALARGSKEERPVAVVPILSPGAYGLSARGRF